jgi:hypothetical protein
MRHLRRVHVESDADFCVNSCKKNGSVVLGRNGLSASELEGLLGISRGKRGDWAREGLLRRRDGYVGLDAAELAALQALMRAGPKRAKRCWRRHRPEVREWVVGRSTDPRAGLWVVVDMRSDRDRIETRPVTALRAASEMLEVQVIDLGSAIRAGLSAFESANVLDADVAGVTPITAARGRNLGS